MIPTVTTLTEEITEKEYPSRTYKIEPSNEAVYTGENALSGGRNLLTQTRELTTDSSDITCWWIGGNRTRVKGADGFYQFNWNITGDTSANWRSINSPIFQLPNNWQGKTLTVSLWVYSDDWSTMDYGMRWRLFLTKGDRSESYRYGQAQILDSGGVPASNMKGDAPENGRWRQIWTTFDLTTKGLSSSGTGSLDEATHAWIGFYCVKNVVCSMKQPKVEIGSVATEWTPALEEVVEPLDSINGYIDDLESVKQSVYLILHTERYKYPIYSWDYGVELENLFGQPMSYVMSELERRIKEALTMDDRIDDVIDFTFAPKKHKMFVTFTVVSNVGDIPTELEVDI